MGRKKSRGCELKPFCYYCDREFDDERVLVMHQKQKHFKCLQCSRKLDTATGLVVHMVQVHKQALNKVPNALVGRDNPEAIVHGMEGVSETLIEEKTKVLKEKIGVKDAKRQERMVWAKVVMAPTFEQFMQNASLLTLSNQIDSSISIPQQPNINYKVPQLGGPFYQQNYQYPMPYIQPTIDPNTPGKIMPVQLQRGLNPLPPVRSMI